MLGYLSEKKRRKELGISDIGENKANIISLWLLEYSFFLLLQAFTSYGRYI
jgi:hypothetical protein